MTKSNIKTATKDDLKAGTLLITSEGYIFTIIRKYDQGIWEARGNSGDKCIFEKEATNYKIQENVSQ